MQQPETQTHIRHNFTVNIIDAAFFGFAALGVASTVTVIPLFMNTLGASAIIIALVGSLHDIGWQIPQLFMANLVSRLPRFKPMVIRMTIHERWPMFGLALVALLIPVTIPEITIILAVILLAIYGLGGGLTATAWQSMIGKIIPQEKRGTFFGMQSGVANLLGAGGALAAGVLLEKLPSPADFALCFGLAGLAMVVSVWFLSRTREVPHTLQAAGEGAHLGWRKMREIVRRDSNFRWFLLARALSSIAWIAVAFYAVHVVTTFKATETTIGILAGVMTISQTIANVIIGWLGDRWGHRIMFALGGLLIAASAGLALFAPDMGWFYVVFALAGAAKATFWATVLALTLEFGEGEERPLYIGLANTLVAPVTLFAPVVGGALAAQFGYQSAFLLAFLAGLLMSGVLLFAMYDPRFGRSTQPIVAAIPEG